MRNTLVSAKVLIYSPMVRDIVLGLVMAENIDIVRLLEDPNNIVDLSNELDAIEEYMTTKDYIIARDQEDKIYKLGTEMFHYLLIEHVMMFGHLPNRLILEEFRENVILELSNNFGHTDIKEIRFSKAGEKFLLDGFNLVKSYLLARDDKNNLLGIESPVMCGWIGNSVCLIRSGEWMNYL